MKCFNLKALCVVTMAVIGFSGSAMAGAVGYAQIGQCPAAMPGGLSGVLVDATHITWSPTGTVAGTGCFDTGSPTMITSSQPTVTSGYIGNIQNLVAGPPMAVDKFLTFVNPANNLDFVLTSFVAPVPNDTCDSGTVANANQSCVVTPGSPFLLISAGPGNGTTIKLNAVGTITDGGVTNTWSILFTTQLPGDPDSIEDTILGDDGSPASSISSTYSATLTIAPEPGTVSMFLLGGIALIGIGRKRFGKS